MASKRWLIVLFVVALTATVGAIMLSQRPGAAAGRSASTIEVYKTATCGCCSKWVDHLREAGFEVTATDISQDELTKFKAQHGVPGAAVSCHTALVDGYVVEGHVPASEVRRLLTERRRIVGLAVPGMPLGSPGMEVSGMTPQPYDVLAIAKDGTTSVFSTIKPQKTN